MSRDCIKLRNRKLLFSLLQSIVIIFAWLPIINDLPSVIRPLLSIGNLSKELQNNIGLFVDFTRLYACAQVAQKSPAETWELSHVIESLKTSLDIQPENHSLESQRQSPVLFTPQYITLITPLTVLSINLAISVFEIISLLVAILSINALLHKYSNFSWREGFLFWLIILGNPAFFQNIIFGQSEILIAGLSAIFLLTWQSKTHITAAAALALTAAIKPHHSLLMLVMALAGGRYKVLGLALLFSILILAGSIYVLGGEAILKYPSIVVAAQNGFFHGKLFFPMENTINLAGIISHIRHRSTGFFFISVSTTLALIIIALIWRRALSAGPQTYPFAYASSLLLMLLLGPYEHFYALFLMSAAWAMTVPATYIVSYYEKKNEWLRVWYIGFLLLPIISWFFYQRFSTWAGQMEAGVLAFLLAVALHNFRTIIEQ